MPIRKTSLRSCILLCFLITNSLSAQPKHFKESFDKDIGWKLSAATAPDSASFEIKDGSLLFHNKQRSAGMVELNMPFNGNLSEDAEWTLRVKLRHLSGSNNFNYGVCLGAKPGTNFTDGLCFGLAANGYYRIDSYFGNKKNELQKWTRFNAIQLADSLVNELTITYRAPWGIFMLINDHWAFMGNGRGREGKTLTLFAEGQQSIAFDDIQLVSYRGQFTKLADVRAQELKEICRFAVDSFVNARAFQKEDEYKTWLPEMFICNRDYKIFRRTEGVFPKPLSKGKAYFVYAINTDYATAADRDAKSAELADLIKSTFGKVAESKTKLGDKTLHYFFAKSPEFPKGTVAILQEYAFRRDYEKADHYYVEFIVVNAPEIKPF